MNRLFGQGLCEAGSEALNIVDFALQGDSWLSKAAEPVPRSSGLFWQELVQLSYSQYNSCEGSQGQVCSALLYQTWLNPAGRKNRMSPFPDDALQLCSLSPLKISGIAHTVMKHQLNVLPCGAAT